MRSNTNDCGLMSVLLVALAIAWAVMPSIVGWAVVIPAWALLGAAYAGLITLGGRLLRRSAQRADLPFLFAAQFSLSHVC